MNTVADCKPWALHQVQGSHDDVSAILTLPFTVQRIYYLYDVMPGATRGHHAHRKLEGVMVASSGSFDVELHDGKNSFVLTLSDPALGLFIPNMIWRVVRNFSTDAVCLVFASGKFEEGEMIYDYNEFLKMKGYVNL
ncbi:WxcM-like domain-containing protein [bacterium]|nr:WxcM-like domain-containing protein [bacterium]